MSRCPSESPSIFFDGPGRCRTRVLFLFSALLAGFAFARPAASHDLWVLPGKFVIAPGEKIRVFINSGDDFPASDSLLGRHRIESLRLHAASGEASLSDFVLSGESLTAELLGPEPGTAILALATRARTVRLHPEEFNQYLEEDGLPRILELRKKLGEMNRPAVERYTKWAKAILQVGDRQDRTWSKALGFKLEIVPQTNPSTLRQGQSLAVVVLFDGHALAGVELTGGYTGVASRRVKTVTDSDGRATLVMEESGRWYLRTIHMLRLADNGDDTEAIWESFWSTLTFEVSP